MTKILVIEDNITILEEVLIWLELEGFDATGASNGNKGVQLALELLPDLILCDIMMPEKDGYRVLIELRANKATSLTPFIFITAKQEKSDIRHGMELGADDYITKPFTSKEFLAAIRSRLERRELFTKFSQQKVQDFRDNLFRSLPHELRTPLVAILGVGTLLEQDAHIITPEEILEYSQMITTSGQQLFRLIENHLLYMQLEMKLNSPQQAITSRDSIMVNPVQLIHNISLQTAQRYNRLNDLDVILEPGALHVHKDHFAKIISEVIDNAFKFSPKASKVKIYSFQESNGYWVEIQDHGHGIKTEDINRIGPYIQFERNKYEQQGAGLGLTIARMCAELYEGSLDLKSTPGVGTTVCIKFPVQS